MKKTIVFLASTLLFVTVCFAHDQRDHYGLNENELKDVKAMLNMSHDAIEGDEAETRLARLKENLNFKKKIKESIRLNQQFKQYSGRDVVVDGLILLGVSHTLETLSGPLAVSYGLANDWNPIVIATAGVIGGVISVPGLDPLCILLIGIYTSSENFRKGIKSLRMLVLGPVDFIDNKLKLSQYIKSKFVKIPAMESLTKTRSFESFYFDEKERISKYVFSYPISPFESVKLEVGLKDRNLYLSKLILPHSMKEYGYDKKRFETWLKAFGWNISSFVTESLNSYIENSKIPFRTYIKDVVSQPEERVEIKLVSDVILLKGKHKLRCKKVFRSN